MVFQNVKIIYCSCNQKITTLNHFKKLTLVSIIGHFCGVDNIGISKNKSKNVNEINCSNNPKITTLNHLKSLILTIVELMILEFQNNNKKYNNIGSSE